ncbi:MAG: methionine--tRNA ligase [Clostridia bacterium]|nr:methionine--tRNA ligase [Clostridia bacterium]MBR7092182.1 methionine--tRNA ligase [Clostridia bacterium]
MKNIIIGGAWPYANGSLHIGHVAALLPGDVLARYYRAKGDRVFYVSGSDCHGTPIVIRAAQENSSPTEISEKYHREFCDVFHALGFSYDLYAKTSDAEHKDFVRAFHEKIYRSPYAEERKVKGAYCPHCNKTLTDRLVVGLCPRCGEKTRGDQCDVCGEVLAADEVVDPRCADCGTAVVFRDSKQIFLRISALEQPLRAYLEAHPYWRRNAVAFTKRYLDEGLRDRAITRDLDWGIDVPKAGYEGKKIYIWAENVLGYLSCVSRLCQTRHIPFDEVYGRDADTRSYYVHGKDNIPFHTIILPSLILAHGGDIRLPDDIISSEHLTLEGKRISTSKNWAIWARDIAERYDPDAIRYFFIANGPEKRDADFSAREFRTQVNSELVGAWGNLVNRTLAFAVKYFDRELPHADIPEALRCEIRSLYDSVGEKIERGTLKDAIDEIFETVRRANKYYDTEQPWKTRNDDPGKCRETIGVCAYLILNLAVLLQPFLPFSSEKLLRWLGTSDEWKEQLLSEDFISENYGVLFHTVE